MKTCHSLLASLVLVALSTVSSQLSTAFAQGSLTPPGAPAPTMKSLSQIEPRTPISSLPVNITQSGSYYLTSSFDLGAGQDGIFVSALNVTIDLNGFTIRSFDPGNTAVGIRIDPLGGYMSDLTILNGHIVGNVMDSGGTYAGSGFGYGIYCAGSPRNVRVVGVTVSGCLDDGINVGFNSTVVESCTVATVGGSGIVANSVSHCTAYQCGSSGIVGTTVSDCYGNSASGVGVNAATAINCYGTSNSGNGIQSSMAENCYGACANSSSGIFTDVANNCYGYSSGGYNGLNAFAANNCHGFCDDANGSYGIGLHAEIAINCIGQSNSPYGTGLAGGIGIGCEGYDTANGAHGLSLTIGNSCLGNNQLIVNKYNMP